MRWIALIAAFGIVAGWAVLRQAPFTADAKPAPRPAARLQAPCRSDSPGPAAQAGGCVASGTALHATGVIRSISLVGHRLPQARLRAVLEARPGQPLDPARLERDRDAMARELAAIGYLAARVEPAGVQYDADGAAYLTFEIEQGKLFHLRAIEVTGIGRDAAVVTLASGDVAIRDRIERARDALVDGLMRRGKPTSVELSVRTDLAAAAVDVVFATQGAPAGPKS